VVTTATTPPKCGGTAGSTVLRDGLPPAVLIIASAT
jgi:hypothetical protein